MGFLASQLLVAGRLRDLEAKCKKTQPRAPNIRMQEARFNEYVAARFKLYRRKQKVDEEQF
jgi:hypothetical protein